MTKKELELIYHFFWSGPFSQWYPCKFKIYDITYNCAEQFMMYEKARIFQDYQSMLAIMSEDSPRKQKSLGRLIKNFDLEIWQQNAKLIVYRGNMAKFCQNNDLYDILQNTGTKILVEASPYDNIWGIGMGENDQNLSKIDQWGKNWLGEVLTTLRNDLFVS